MKLRLLVFSFSLLLAAGPLGAVVSPAPPVDATEESARDAVREYRQQLREMDRKERRQLKREQRKAVKAAVADHRSSADGDVSQLLLVILAILLPPLAVFLHEGEINSRFWISLLLTLLFFLPGVIYALIVVLD